MGHIMNKTLSTFFEIHFHQLIGNKEKALSLLKTAIENTSAIPIEHALWTWLLTEQVLRFDDKQLLSEFYSFISESVKGIETKWNEKQEHLFLPLENDIFTSHLAIYYATLVNLKNLGYRLEIQETATKIRDLVFDGQLKGGMVICSPRYPFATADLLLSVLPFGLFSPEDLVMVEAVKGMEKTLVYPEKIVESPLSNDHSNLAAALFSWYYLEKGDIEKAKYYQSLNNGIQGSSSFYLGDIIQQYALLNEQDRFQIKHEPFGNGNKYEPQVYERFPRMPIEREEVIIQFTAPFSQSSKAFVHVEASGKAKVVKASFIKGDTPYWKANIGSFSVQEEVTYYIEWYGDKRSLLSPNYSFHPLKKVEIWQLEGMMVSENLFKFWPKNMEIPFLLLIDTKLQKIYIHHKKIKKTDMVSSVNVNQLLSTLNLPCFYDDTYVAPIRLLINHTGDWINLSLRFNSPLYEGFFGMGERYHQLEYRGEKLDCYVYNQYRDQGARTYMPIPFFFSSLGYGFHFDTSQYTHFDFAKTLKDVLDISISQQLNEGAAFTFFRGSPLEIVGQFTNKTGPAEMLPVWAFGPWMSSNNWDRDEVVREQVRKTTELQIPSTVLVLEQWSDEATYYIFNDTIYEPTNGGSALSYKNFTFPHWGRWPNPKKLVEFINKHGMELILWQIPIMKYLNRQHHPQKDYDEKYMIEKQYFIKDQKNRPYRIPEGWFKESLLMDFSNIEGSKWWFDKRQYLLDIGVAGFKTDGGEMVFGDHLQFADNRLGSEMRNTYPNEYIKAYYEFAQAKRPNNAMTFSRAGYTGAQKYPAHWAGDERSTFEAFRRSLIAGLSSGLSGVIMWGWDLAGFNGEIPTAELFIRSAQMAAFCPIMQYHAESKAEFNQDRTPWNIAERTNDERAIRGYRFYANVRMNLLPYIVEQARLSVLKGIPLMRAMVLECPDDPKTFSMFDQYFFGNQLLVAPMILEGAKRRTVYLPKGKWINLFSKQVYQGAQIIEVEAPLMEIPVYLRNNTCLITNVSKESLTLGSYVGNSINSYDFPLIHIACNQSFFYQGQDHLNQKWKIDVKKSEKNVFVNIEINQHAFAIAFTNTSEKEISLSLNEMDQDKMIGPNETAVLFYPL